MDNGIDIQFVRENYQKMTDAELVRVATQDAAGLTVEAQEVVKEEIEKRGLERGIINGVRTIQAIGQNIKSKKTNRSDAPNKYLRGFILAKVGQFETYKESKEKLKEIISVA